MQDERHVILRASARRVTPVILVVAVYLVVRSEAGGGLQAGALAALVLVLHAVLFGAAATLAAIPPIALRIATAVGVAMAMAGLMAPPAWRLVMEFGLALGVAAGFALGFVTIAGRAHELRGGDW